MNNIYNAAEKAIDLHLTQTLTKRQRKAISVCNADLYFGPYYTKGGRSRWHIWAPLIEDVVNDLPRELWYDEQLGEVLDREPKAEEVECMESYGHGKYDATPCPVCEGTGLEWLEPCWDDYYYFDRRAIKHAVLGKELASYF
ncbi:MAG: hypothetical protein MN733_00655 [Nitrososphaera sp.]|nr:hypothetical protein [Nitrososphaera sp.]